MADDQITLSEYVAEALDHIRERRSVGRSFQCGLVRTTISEARGIAVGSESDEPIAKILNDRDDLVSVALGGGRWKFGANVPRSSLHIRWSGH